MVGVVMWSSRGEITADSDLAHTPADGQLGSCGAAEPRGAAHMSSAMRMPTSLQLHSTPLSLPR